MQKRETWEDEKTLADMEQYYWDLNPSKQNVVSILQRIQEVDKVGWGWGEGGILQKHETWEDEKTLGDMEYYHKFTFFLHVWYKQDLLARIRTTYLESRITLKLAKTHISPRAKNPYHSYHIPCDLYQP